MCITGSVYVIYLYIISTDPCVTNGQIYEHGEETERCGLWYVS